MEAFIESIDRMLNSWGEARWALPTIAIVIGSLCVAVGWWSLQSPRRAQEWLRGLPRNESLGRVLIGIDLIWALFLYYKSRLDLGGAFHFFGPHQPGVYLLSPFLYVFMIRYVNNYLGARSIALFLLLVAKPILVVCFLRDETSRLLITSLAYFWIVVGILFFSMPHWMRDVIAFRQASAQRWTLTCRMKIGFGLILLFFGIFIY